jgi:cytochrome c oxidase accessory protein FixG
MDCHSKNKSCKNGDCPPSTEADLQLFKKQEIIYPKAVSGKFRSLKWLAMGICLTLYYLAPFIRWDRGGNAPDQAILIDMERGRAYWFWFEIWPQEVYILTGILIVAAIALFFVTSILGRVWCGFFCFQTVWTDLFMLVERHIQGDSYKRKKLREGPWNLEKIYKLGATHIAWIAIAWFTAGSFVLYFNDAPTLVRSFFELNVSPTVLGFIGGLTFSTYLLAGFAREQVCTYMCPYARFQSAMFDKETLIISYDPLRGEPRAKHKKGADWTGLGDCVDCTACVQVCPTGIDIRDGLQMECIACGLCIDACDDIMDKVGLPRGLIAYHTEKYMDNHQKGEIEKFHLLRPRTIYYIIVLSVVTLLMVYALLTRPPLDLTVLHDRNPLFVTMSNGDIRNGYDIKILNKTHQDRSYKLSVYGLDKPKVLINTAGHVDINNITVSADSVGQYRVFVELASDPQEPKNIIFKLVDIKDRSEVSYETMFISER